MDKMCKHHRAKRCWHDSCSLVDEFGMVGVCPLHPNKDGFFRSRKVVPVLRPMFSKHLRGGC